MDPARFLTGLIVGRFDPPHRGHSYMIEWAAERVGDLVVYVNSGAGDAAPGRLRAAWLNELHPAVGVIEVRHDLPTDFGDDGLWERWMALFRRHWPHDAGPHAVFSSEPYVDGIARR
ncbi:MAG: adenylyltransferase/cytidyltransferase family protein, partial [Ilumatobacteraceae bacterium]